jgi:hypothetical protein
VKGDALAIAERVQASYKVKAATKNRVDLMASALGVDKSKVVDEAIELLAKRRRHEISTFLERAQASLSALSDESPGEVLTGRRRTKGYSGGPVPR